MTVDPQTPTEQESSARLDPQAKAVIDLVESAIANGAPPMWELDPVSARASYKLMSQFGGPGEEVQSVENLEIPGPGGAIPVRIYRPASGTLGAFVFYHGGGFVIGDLDTHDRECRRMANRSGHAVVSVDYRLAPEGRFPAATDDAWAALCWVRDHPSELDIDPARLGVGGDSAGGNLAAVTAIRARDEGMVLKHQLLVYPAVDISEGVNDRYPSRMANDGLVLSVPMNDWFIGHYVGEELPMDQRLTPINEATHRDLAPAMVIVAECDPLRDEGVAYAHKLESDGVPVVLSEYEGQIHGFFNMGPSISSGWDAVDEAAAAIKLALD